MHSSLSSNAALAVALPIVAVVVLVGCAGPDRPLGPDPSGVVSSGPMSASPTGSAAAANEVVPEAAVDLVRAPWQRVEPVPGSAEVLVHGTLSGGPPCAVLGRVDLTETAGSVTVTVWAGRRPGADCAGPQPELGYPYVTRVRLASPLGSRTVRDGAR
jgi:hypothetical protein